MDGDPLEICSIAALLALNCTKEPKVELYPGESGEMEDFDISGDISEGLPVDTTNVPICITVLKIDSDLMIVDSSGSEQSCGSCMLSIAIDRYGNCCGIKYIKTGTLTIEELASAISVRTAARRDMFK